MDAGQPVTSGINGIRHTVSIAVEQKSLKCFVIMPFGDPHVDADRAQRLDHIYEEWIKPTVESVSMTGGVSPITCSRADKEVRPGAIISHVVEQLATADLVIADLSGRNPNVFYELGVRHAVGKNTILIADDLSDVPFDLRHLRCIPYGFDPRKLVPFRRTLAAAVTASLTDEEPPSDPVSAFFLSQQNLQATVVNRSNSGSQSNLEEQFRELRTAFEGQMASMRVLVEAILAQPRTEPQNNSAELAALSRLVGVWIGMPEGSVMYSSFVKGAVEGVYRYGNRLHQAGRFFNFRLIGDTVFARFEWFDDYVRGFSMYKFLSDDVLDGGWWERDILPDEVYNGLKPPGLELPGMVPHRWIRQREVEPPDWATSYFQTN